MIKRILIIIVVLAGVGLIHFQAEAKASDLELGAGLQQQSTNFAGNRRFNFQLLGGGGATFRVAENVRLMAGMRYFHASDAGIEGGGGGFDGLQFYAGSMFPF